jgi:ankyrin repeat protein
VFWGDDAVVQQLIKAGADVNQANKNGDTPLAQALLLERLAIAEMLREAGAKEEADELEEFTHEGETLCKYDDGFQNRGCFIIIKRLEGGDEDEYERWGYIYPRVLAAAPHLNHPTTHPHK